MYPGPGTGERSRAKVHTSTAQLCAENRTGLVVRLPVFKMKFVVSFCITIYLIPTSRHYDDTTMLLVVIFIPRYHYLLRIRCY